MKFDLKEAMEMMQKMQSELARIQEEARERIYEAQSGAGFVTAKVNGNLEIVDISISDEAFALGDKSLLEDLISAAVNQALEKAKQEGSSDIQKLLGPLSSNFNLNL
jgi:hypothetical protein